MKTRDLVLEQMALMNKIRNKANINMVTCGNCGTILLHKRKSINADNSIICFGCKTKMDLSHCSDYWYSGVENNEEFNND